MKAQKSGISAYSGPGNRFINEICKSLKRELWRCAHSNLGRWPYSGSRYCNFGQLDRIGLELLRQSQWTPVQTDKDGGYALLLKSDYEEIMYDGLESDDMYEEFPRDCLNSSTIADAYFHLCEKISKHDGTPLKQLVMKSPDRIRLVSNSKSTSRLTNHMDRSSLGKSMPLRTMPFREWAAGCARSCSLLLTVWSI